jgi:N-carbamoylputrescine amidase
MSDNTEKVRIGLIQHACPIDSTKQSNLEKAVAMIRKAAEQGCDVVLTQELFCAHYFPQVEDAALFDLAESIPGPTSKVLCNLARELGIEILASLFERRTAGLYHNTSVVIDIQGQIIGKYRKMHIPDDPRFYEKFYFTPGDVPGDLHTDCHGNGEQGKDLPSSQERFAGWQVQSLRKIKTGTLICWDQWFPEAARLTVLRGAQLLVYPTAIGYAACETESERMRQIDAWITMQRSHSIANGVFVAAINRVGVEEDLTFWGRSFVVDPGGQVVAQASGSDEEVLVVELDLKEIEQARQGWPFLRDRRIDGYGDLLKRFVD